MSKFFIVTIVLTSFASIVGCGTQGPLYIPEQRYPQKTQDDAPKAPEVAPAKQTTNQ